MKNIGSTRFGGAIHAAQFIQRFIHDNIPWAHLDIAGPARADKDSAELVEGGTGFGVRTLIKLIQSFESPKSD